MLLGEVAGTPVYIDGDQDDRWGSPDLLIDVSPGPAMGFSLEGVNGVHFVAVSLRRVARSSSATTAPTSPSARSPVRSTTPAQAGV